MTPSLTKTHTNTNNSSFGVFEELPRSRSGRQEGECVPSQKMAAFNSHFGLGTIKPKALPGFEIKDVDSDDGNVDGSDDDEDCPPDLVGNEPKSRTMANLATTVVEEDSLGQGRAKSLSLRGGILAHMQPEEVSNVPQHTSNSFTAQPTNAGMRQMAQSLVVGPNGVDDSGRLYEKVSGVRPLASSYSAQANQANASSSSITSKGSQSGSSPTTGQQKVLWDTVKFGDQVNPTRRAGTASATVMRDSLQNVSVVSAPSQFDNLASSNILYDSTAWQIAAQQQAEQIQQAQAQQVQAQHAQQAQQAQQAQAQQAQQQQQMQAAQQQQLLMQVAHGQMAQVQLVHVNPQQAQVQAQVAHAQAQAQAQAHAQAQVQNVHIVQQGTQPVQMVMVPQTNCSSSSILSHHSSATGSPRAQMMNNASYLTMSGNLQQYTDSDAEPTQRPERNQRRNQNDGRQSGYSSGTDMNGIQDPDNVHELQQKRLTHLLTATDPTGKVDKKLTDGLTKGEIALRNHIVNKQRLIEKLGDGAGWDWGTRPCEHNSWDDVRSRNGVKVLRCRVCLKQFKLPSYKVPRCLQFLQDSSCHKPNCELLHVHKKKRLMSEAMPDTEQETEPDTETHGGEEEDETEEVCLQPGTTEKEAQQGPPANDDGDKQNNILGALRARHEEVTEMLTEMEKQFGEPTTLCPHCKLRATTPFCGQTGLPHEQYTAQKEDVLSV